MAHRPRAAAGLKVLRAMLRALANARPRFALADVGRFGCRVLNDRDKPGHDSGYRIACRRRPNLPPRPLSPVIAGLVPAIHVARRARALTALAAIAVLALLAATDARAVQPSEILPDPVLEARAREISKELRCLVCQNQSIDDSDAELAHDLRLLVRERVAAGDSNGEVVDYVVSRYGDFVLLRPPFKESTYALWLGPAAILGVGVLAVVVYYRRRGAPRSDAPPLSESESRRLAGLLEDETR